MSRKTVAYKARVPSLIIAELIVGITAATVSLFIFIELALNISSLQSLDSSLSHFFITLRSPLLTQLMLLITLFGNQALLVLLAFVALMLVLKEHGRDAVVFILIVGIGIAINLFMKDLIARARPDIAPLVYERFYSFPSGHAMNSFVFYTSVALYMYRNSARRALTRIIIALCGVIILLIGVSRIYLGVHYPTDVLAGLIGGFWWVATALVIEKSLHLSTRLFQRTA